MSKLMGAGACTSLRRTELSSPAWARGPLPPGPTPTAFLTCLLPTPCTPSPPPPLPRRQPGVPPAAGGRPVPAVPALAGRHGRPRRPRQPHGLWQEQGQVLHGAQHRRCVQRRGGRGGGQAGLHGGALPRIGPSSRLRVTCTTRQHLDVHLQRWAGPRASGPLPLGPLPLAALQWQVPGYCRGGRLLLSVGCCAVLHNQHLPPSPTLHRLWSS